MVLVDAKYLYYGSGAGSIVDTLMQVKVWIAKSSIHTTDLLGLSNAPYKPPLNVFLLWWV